MAEERKRSTVKDSFDKAGEDIAKAFGKIGLGFKTFGDKTKEKLNPQEIAVKLDEVWDKAVVQPTKRTIDFFDDSLGTHKKNEQHQQRVSKAQAGAKRWKVVFAKPLQDLGPYRPPKFVKSEVDNALIRAALKDNFVFQHVSSKLLPGLIDAFEPIMIHKGDEIIKEGGVGDYFYVIGSGVVAFSVDGKHVGDANPGQSFGELALLYEAPRAATCVAKSACGLFRLDQETFRRLMAQEMEDANKEIIEILKKVPYFKDLDDNYLMKIVNNMKFARFNAGESIVKKGDTVTKFVIMKEGRVKATDIEAGGSSYKELEFSEGDFFGESAIVEGYASLGNVTAVTDTVALTISKEVFDKVIGKDFTQIVKRTMDKKKLVSVL